VSRDAPGGPGSYAFEVAPNNDFESPFAHLTKKPDEGDSEAPPKYDPGIVHEHKASPLRWIAVLLVLLAILGGAAVFLLKQKSFVPSLPPASTSYIEIKPSPNVVLAVRDLARLETAEYHMERVVEITDQQSKMWGLVHAKDAILLVAVGDVVAGVDMKKVTDADVTTDWAKKRVSLRVPAPEIFSSRLDSTKTHVYSRATDHLASRREDLETRARAEAEQTMRKGAEDAAILDRARANAERSLRALLKSLGFEEITIEWK
jgi:hypothetical protein